MSSPLIRSGECRKFAPNIFNKTKCTNCFRQKEEHSAEALESNRASRKIAKCGYLFVAPGWDFTIPLNRTKRWQRRWFVLYDDGELSYALDEHPETVPQCSIDMNKVLEVTEAEDITGNSYSLAITAPDNVHFVKGTCREEARWWAEVLSVFPRSKGRHKRNATFPGSQSGLSTSSMIQSTVRGSSSEVCTRYGGCSVPPSWEGEDVFPTRDRDVQSIAPVAHESPPTPPTDTRKGHPEVSRRLLLEEFESECKLKDIADSITRPRHRRVTSPTTIPSSNGTSNNSSSQEPTRDGDTQTHKQVRGDPDGCGLDLSSLRYSPSSELRVDLPAEDLLNIKKGWLMKQAGEKEWNKHWFVLRGAALLYYRDPAAEDQGILDGVIDLSGVSSVSEVQVARNYGFQTMTWDERRYVLSAVTAGIRSNWMAAIRRAAGLQEDISSSPLQPEREVSSVLPSTPLTPRSIVFSSDEEYRTASEGGRRESSDWGDTLPPSPPLNRTPISRVKERARGGSRSRGYANKRSRSSPPSSRRSTLDSVRQEDFVLACCGEIQESDAEDHKLEKGNSTELEELKKQLTGALRELSNAEEELIRLRQRKADISALETQVEELLQRVDEAGKQRAKDAAEMDSLKKRFVDDKSRWEHDLQRAECELQAASDQCSQLCNELSECNSELCRLQQELARSDELIHHLRDELAAVSERLTNGIEENDALYRRIRELEGRAVPMSSMREKARSVDSLSDLTNIDLDLDLQQLDKDRVVEEYEDLRARFEKAVAEIRAMKRELRESQAQTDCLELSLIHARQDLKCRTQAADAQQALMAARIQDLALKLSAAEKQIRTLKQKLSKSETREKRRSLSLKGRESFSICKELEDKLAELEKKICSLDGSNTNTNNLTGEEQPKTSSNKSSCNSNNNSNSSSSSTSKQITHSDSNNSLSSVSSSPGELNGSNKVTSRLRRKSLDSATSSEPMKVLIRLSSLEAKVSKAAKGIIISRSSPSSSNETMETNFNNIKDDSVELKVNEDVVDGLEQNKQQTQIFNEIKKMENLLRSKLNDLSKKRENLIASGQWTNEAKLNLLAEKLAYESVLVGRLHDAVSQTSMIDLNDAERLIVALDSKLYGSDTSNNKPNIETSLDYLTRTLSRHLAEQSKLKPRKIKEKKKSAESPAVLELVKKKKIIDQKVSKFLEEIVDELAMVFAIETLGNDSESTGENRIKEAWSLAQEAVNEELIQAEISQVMVQCCKTYEHLIDKEYETRFLGLLHQRASLELWANSSRDILNKEMEVAVKKLHDKYQENLLRLKSEKKSIERPSEDDEEKARILLQRFVDVVAHKALLDTRMSLLTESSSPLITSEEKFLFDENAFLSEVQNLYVKYCYDLRNEIGGGSCGEGRIKEAFGDVFKEVDLLRDRVVDCVRERHIDTSGVESDSISSEGTKDSENADWVDVACCYCSEIKERLIQLQMCLAQGKDCQRCAYLQEELKRREVDHSDEMSRIQQRQKQDMTELQNTLEEERQKLVNQHEQEQALLKERARKLERRLGTLDSEYTQQMDNLRAAYHKTLSTTLDRDLQGEENIRQRYQAEIEHLRALCEKGLMGMENSHRRIIAELEEKHRQELEALRVEKEQALAEETQATLAALDAMRKAHEAEVQKEITKFKSEFLKKMQSSHDIGALHKEHEAEMEEIKKEILSLSEKYSVKCVESAALEEELRVANSQLAQAQQHILQLDSRNKQLRAHLVAEANDLTSENLKARQRDCDHCNEIENKTKDTPQVPAHGDSLCVHLSNGGHTHMHTHTHSPDRAAVVSAIVDKLKIAAWNQYRAGSRSDSSVVDLRLKSKSRLEPSPLSNAELKRYPALGCGRSIVPFRSPSPCALSGMVAERKKMFEQ
ncbi:myosin phosphatase Rho interacting protein outspread isoform X3 [Lycorma delicatula]|uniref:myosin phosphatase Rho interacting protein outspread isoform X3 n=1 Tax=Lycorma delicatula TaxID=130591 RepID=UPI003F51AB60